MSLKIDGLDNNPSGTAHRYLAHVASSLHGIMSCTQGDNLLGDRRQVPMTRCYYIDT